MSAEKLTGRTRLRRDWRGRMILEVEFRFTVPSAHYNLYDDEYVKWRDARLDDMQFLILPTPSEIGWRQRQGGSE